MCLMFGTINMIMTIFMLRKMKIDNKSHVALQGTNLALIKT